MEEENLELPSQIQKPTGVMKRARWGATHRIHEHFVDGFPELEERFVREREAAERRFEYNLGSRNFATKREGEEGIDTLKVLFRKLDRAIGLRDATMVQTIREEFLQELRHWNWRKGARVEFKRRKQVHNPAQLRPDNRTKPRLQASRDKSIDTTGVLKDDGLIPAGPSKSIDGTTADDATAAMTLATAYAGPAPSPKSLSQKQMAASELFGSSSLAPSKTKTSSSGLDDSSVDDLDADDVDAIDERLTQRRVKPRLEEPSDANDAADEGPQDKVAANDARRHLLAESVAVALVTLKWRCLQPDSEQNGEDTKAAEEHSSTAALVDGKGIPPPESVPRQEIDAVPQQETDALPEQEKIESPGEEKNAVDLPVDEEQPLLKIENNALPPDTPPNSTTSPAPEPAAAAADAAAAKPEEMDLSPDEPNSLTASSDDISRN